MTFWTTRKSLAVHCNYCFRALASNPSSATARLYNLVLFLRRQIWWELLLWSGCVLGGIPTRLMRNFADNWVVNMPDTQIPKSCDISILTAVRLKDKLWSSTPQVITERRVGALTNDDRIAKCDCRIARCESTICHKAEKRDKSVAQYSAVYSLVWSTVCALWFTV